MEHEKFRVCKNMQPCSNLKAAPTLRAPLEFFVNFEREDHFDTVIIPYGEYVL